MHKCFVGKSEDWTKIGEETDQERVKTDEKDKTGTKGQNSTKDETDPSIEGPTSNEVRPRSRVELDGNFLASFS